MINVPTVLVLGAGSSKPYGYPIGSRLKNDIIAELQLSLDTDSGWINELDIDKELVKEFIKKFDRSPKSSIDSFLAQQKKYTEIGKSQ